MATTVSDSKSKSKAEKKAAKAQVKLEKKRAEIADAQEVRTLRPRESSGQDVEDSHPTPADRSAAAAEKQVRLQKLRVGIALLALIASLVAIWFTFGR